MGTVIELSYGNPSYNGGDLAESNELATALDQYWRERRTRYEETLERQRSFGEDSVAERNWQNFCAGGTSILDKYVRAAAAVLGSRLHVLWGDGSGIAREAQRAFEKEAYAEMWLPFSVSPLKFVSLSRQSPIAQIRQLPNSDHPENYELGKAHLVIRWRDKHLFMVLPTETYVTFSTFVFTKNDVSWNTEEAVPKSFSKSFSTFRPYFEMAEESFATVRTIWEAREAIAQYERLLQRIPAYSEAWAKVQIPDAQKLDILRRMELFESGDPAAPYGLLLCGPTGTGKSLIARTIAETTNCDF